MKKPALVQGIGLRDITMVDDTGKPKASYDTWQHMLTRCYSSNYHLTHPTYKGCSVCTSWLLYSVFEEWFDQNYVPGFELDKDCLIRGNKVYGPTTCRYIPRDLNSLINHYSARVGNLPLGVTIGNKKFVSRCHKPVILRTEGSSNSQYLGTFDNPQDAEIAYLKCKADFITISAHHYWKEGAIQDDLRGAFLTFAGQLIRRAERLEL